MLQSLFQMCPSGAQLMPSLAPPTDTNNVFGDFSLQRPHALHRNSGILYKHYSGGLQEQLFWYNEMRSHKQTYFMTTRSEVWFWEDISQMLWEVDEFSLLESVTACEYWTWASYQQFTRELCSTCECHSQYSLEKYLVILKGFFTLKYSRDFEIHNEFQNFLKSQVFKWIPNGLKFLK